MVQRTVGWVVGGVAAALLTAGAARAQGAGKATVVLRDGRTIEAAQVEFRERTFVVHTTDGKEERLDERDVLRVELGAQAGARKAAVHAPPHAFAARPVAEDQRAPSLALGWTPGESVGVVTALEVERRERPDGAWTQLASLRPDAKRAAGVFVDEGARWPRRYDYRLTSVASPLEGFSLAEADVRRAVTLLDVGPPRGTWVSLAALGSEVVVEVRRGTRSAQVRAAVGQPLVVDGQPIGARVAALEREADGTPSLRVAWDGVAEPEVVRADAAFGDPERPLVFVGPAPVGAARPAPRVAIDLRQASVAATARTLGVEAGGAFALVQVDPARRVDLRLRSSSFDQAAALVAELLDRKALPWAGVTALSAPNDVADRFAPATSPLTARLDGERLTVLVSAPEAYDLPAALDLFAAATGIDVVLSTQARQASRRAQATFVRAPAATLAQALTLLAGSAGLTWTTRGEVILVKAHEELSLDEVWLDLDTPEGTTLEALVPTLRASGIELWSSRLSLRMFGQPRRAGRVALSHLLEGLSVERRVSTSGVLKSLHLDGPARAEGCFDVFVMLDGQVWLRADDGATTVERSVDALRRRVERPRLWAADPGPALQALREGGSTVVSVNGRPPAPPASAPPARQPAVAPEGATAPADLERWTVLVASIDPQDPARSSVTVRSPDGGAELVLAAGAEVGGHRVQAISFEGAERIPVLTFEKDGQVSTVRLSLQPR